MHGLRGRRAYREREHRHLRLTTHAMLGAGLDKPACSINVFSRKERVYRRRRMIRGRGKEIELNREQESSHQCSRKETPIGDAPLIEAFEPSALGSTGEL
jgi:hypothetical protein